MKKISLLVLLLLISCDQPGDEEYGWKVVEGTLECTNPDIRSGDSVCTWFCRDFKEKKIDIIAKYLNDKFYLNVRNSNNCGRTDLNPSHQGDNTAK